MNTARFCYRVVADRSLVLVVDESGRFGGPSVTNAAAEVIDRLGRLVPDLERWRVIYADTDGVWDELVLSPDGRFAAFGLLRARSEAGAIEATELTRFDQHGNPVARL